MLDLVCSVSQLGKEMPQLFLHRGFCAQAQVRGDLFACPVPDRLVGIEIRTIARQIHQSQAQVWSSQVGTHGITAMGWGIVPEHDQSSGVLFPQLLQESGRGLGVTVPFQLHKLHFAGLQAHRRVIAGLFAPPGAGRIYQRWLSFEYPFPPQVRIRPEMGLISEEDLRPHLLRLGQEFGIHRHEGFPLGLVGLQETFLRERLEDNWLTNFTQPQNQKYDGRLITEIAEMRGQDPADALFDLLVEENLGISTVGLGTNPHTLHAFVSHPSGMIASDAILFGEYPNPRSYGCFPIVLAEFVRAEKHLKLPEAIRKMTSFPAQRLGLPDRGLLRDGFKADIVAVNADTVKTHATLGDPKHYPVGIEYVIVNGRVVIDRGGNTGVLPGRAPPGPR